MNDAIEEIEKALDEGAERPKLPNMNEFSPGTLEMNSIRRLLDVLHPHQANKPEAIGALIAGFPKLAATKSERQKINRANNVLIGMRQCGLLVEGGRNAAPMFTPLATSIYGQASDEEASDLFSLHLLEKRHGLELIDVVDVIRTRGERVSLESIRDELRSRGFEVTENEGNASKIRQWLEASGIVHSDWTIDDARLRVLTGASHETLGEWSALTRPQRVFLETIRRITLDDGQEWVLVRQIKRQCELVGGRKIFPEGRLREAVIVPLVDAGWIESRGTGAGRGGDSGHVKAALQLADLKVKFPLDSVSAIPADLREKLSVPTEQILADLKVSNTHKKGIALELLALRLCRDIGLFPVAFRERSSKTQGAEVDLIANGIHLHYSRWLLQCKNTKTVEMKDLAKEIGMAVLLKAHVVVLVTTGRFRRTVIDGADGLATTSALQAILIDGKLLERYRVGGGSAVIECLNASAYKVLELKKTQVLEIEE